MRPKIQLRELTDPERQELEQLAGSRTAEARLVERARIVLAAAGGRRASAIARDLGLSRPTVYTRIKRFNAQGTAALPDQPRSGRPATYPPERVAEVLAAALTDPQALGLPFASWTLDRLRAYLDEHEKIPIKRSRIDEILPAEGLRWRQQESWFGDRVDPAFAAKSDCVPSQALGGFGSRSRDLTLTGPGPSPDPRVVRCGPPRWRSPATCGRRPSGSPSPSCPAPPVVP